MFEISLDQTRNRPLPQTVLTKFIGLTEGKPPGRSEVVIEPE